MKKLGIALLILALCSPVKASSIFTSSGGSGGSLTTDSVGTAELNDGSSTPTTGYCVKVDSSDSSKFEYGACGTGSGDSISVDSVAVTDPDFQDSSEINVTDTSNVVTWELVAGSIDETKLDTSTNASLDLADSAVQTEVDPTVDTEAEIEAILGIGFGTKTATSGNLLQADGVDFESVAPSTINISSFNNDSGFITSETDDQTVDTFSYSAGVITLALENDGEADYTVDISAVDTDTQLSQEQVEDYAGAMTTLNTETLITVTYQDIDGTIDYVVDGNLSNYTNDAGFLTAEVDGSTTNEIQNLFQTISTTSGTAPVADTSTDTLTLTAGSGITITGDSATDTITIAATGGASGDVTDVGDCTGSDCFTADGTGNSLVFEGSTADTYELTLTAPDVTSDLTVTLPNFTTTLIGGTLATDGKLPYNSGGVLADSPIFYKISTGAIGINETSPTNDWHFNGGTASVFALYNNDELYDNLLKFCYSTDCATIGRLDGPGTFVFKETGSTVWNWRVDSTDMMELDESSRLTIGGTGGGAQLEVKTGNYTYVGQKIHLQSAHAVDSFQILDYLGTELFTIDQSGNITTVGTVDGRDVATDGTKLDGIEASADVTDTANVTSAGALMDSEVDADLKTLALPASTTISTFGATLVDDADAPTARTTLGVDAAGTDNSTDVTLAGIPDYITISGQEITRGTIDISDDTNLSAGTGATLTGDSLSVDLGTTIDSSEIVDGTISEADLKVVDTPTDEECLTYESTTGDFEWQTCGSGGGDSISIDSVAVVDPDFVSTGDIDFVDTSNTITANINAGAIVNTDINASAAIDASKLDTAVIISSEIDTFSELNTIVADKTLVNTADAATITGDYDFGGGTLQVPNSTTLPASCDVGDAYMDTDATSGSRWYLCESANTWAVQGGGGGGSGSPTLADIATNSTTTAEQTFALNSSTDFIIEDSAGQDQLIVDDAGNIWVENKIGEIYNNLTFFEWQGTNLEVKANNVTMIRFLGGSSAGTLDFNPALRDVDLLWSGNYTGDLMWLDGDDESGWFDMPMRPSIKSSTVPKTCSSTYAGFLYYDTDLNEYCYCDSTNWVQMNDTSTTCS